MCSHATAGRGQWHRRIVLPCLVAPQGGRVGDQELELEVLINAPMSYMGV